MTMARMVIDWLNWQSVGLTKPSLAPDRTPATAAMAALSEKASSFICTTGTPTDEAAISFSRMAIHARPMGEWKRRWRKKTVATRTRAVTVKLTWELVRPA